MSVISKASFVQIPSGYGEDNLYSEVPNTTNGDFTFTRASTGTRVNSDGYIEEVPWNIASYSEDYSSGSWVATNLSVTTDDTTSPRGDTTADKITTTSSGVETRIRNSSFYQTPSTQHTFSAYAKKGNVNWFLLRNIAYGSSKRAWFDLENGVVGTVNSGLTATIEDVGDGWFRCSVTGTTTSSPTQIIDFSSAPNDNDFQADAVGEFCYVWGVQLVKGNAPKTYIKTTDRLDIPRLDYSGGATNPTLLLEPQRTNLVTYSEDMSNWSVRSPLTLSSQIEAPDGNISAYGYVHSGTTAQYRCLSYFTYPSGSTTGSTFIKKGTKSWIAIRMINSFQYYDIENIELGSSAGAQFENATIESFNSEWLRLTLTVTGHGSADNIQVIAAESDGNTSTVTGTSGDIMFYVWGTQVEQGSLTSYIPTSGTSTTRIKDVCDDGGDATIFNDAEGVIFADIASLSNVGVINRSISLSDGSNTNQIVIRFATTANQITAYITDGGVITAQLSYTLNNALNYNKIALKYKVNDVALWVNGTEVATDTSATMPSGFDELKFSRADGVNTFEGKCKQLIYFNQALTNDELEELTTI